MKFVGKMSVFGGKNDKGMVNDTGLAFYEAYEADQRPDIFIEAPDDEPLQPTWKRLRADFHYIALNVDHSKPRWEWRDIPWKITNPKTGKWVIGFLVDRGPGASDRVCDASYCIASCLKLDTDDVVEVTELGNS